MYFWGPEMLSLEARASMSSSLLEKLSAAIQEFARLLLKAPQPLLDLVLRRNIAILIEPLLELRSKGKLGTVVIYSNTSVSSSLELAKALIEQKFEAPGLFSMLADATHPLRLRDYPMANVATRSKGDRSPIYIPGRANPVKQILTLRQLFQEGVGGATAERITANQILFVDDMQPKHRLAEQEKEGLTYIVPRRYWTRASQKQKMELLILALKALETVGLLDDSEYLNSAFFKQVDDSVLRYARGRKEDPIDSFGSALTEVWDEMKEDSRVAVAANSAELWKDDSASLKDAMAGFLEKIQAL
jgi:hypothetical protein